MKIVGMLFLLVWLWVMPATLSIALIAGLVAASALAGPWPWFVWLLLSPTLYFVWLIAFLAFCALSFGRMGERRPKPRYASMPASGRNPEGPKMILVGACSFRRNLIASLPLTAIFPLLPGGQKLLFRSYSPSVHIGKGAQVLGILTDPDLTEIGDFTIVGVTAAISGHVWTVLPNGKRVYVTAPVKIGKRVMVGAGSLVLCGCSIGDDAVIEPQSHLEPHTVVPAGEIWGGAPAVFRAKRTRVHESGALVNSTD